MASITIRDLPDATKNVLRIHAAQHGQSLEAYLRNMLQEAARKDSHSHENILEIATKCFGKKQGIELVLPDRHSTRTVTTFDV